MTMPRQRYLPLKIVDIVKGRSLLEHHMLIGVDVNGRDEAGRNALYWAIENHNIYNAKMLIEHEISLKVTPDLHALFHAIQEDHYELIILLIQNGINPNITDNKGYTALMYAIEKEQFRTVCFLVRNGADLFQMDEHYDMAEEYANRCQSEEIKDFIKHVLILNENEEKEAVQSPCDFCKDPTC